MSERTIPDKDTAKAALHGKIVPTDSDIDKGVVGLRMAFDNGITDDRTVIACILSAVFNA